MNIVLISSSASYHHLAQKMQSESAVTNIWHYGASPNVSSDENYQVMPAVIPYDRRISKDDINDILIDIERKPVDLVLTSHLSVSGVRELHQSLKNKNVPYFFVEPNVAHIELDRIKTKKLLKYLDIPHGSGNEFNGRYLFENFYNIPTPFVIKLKSFMHGRQTIIINDENKDQSYKDLFSIFLNLPPDKMNIGMDTELVVEDYVNIKKEFSYHALVNKHGWSYFGSARDYKTINDNDTGFNTIGLGAYSLDTIDNRAHEYADKIIGQIQKYLKGQEQYYKGFIFINFAESVDGELYVLEINSRAGEPEIDCIMDTLNSPLSETLFHYATDSTPIDISFNKKKSMAVRLIKKNFDWTKPNYLELKFKNFPEYLNLSLQGNDGVDLYPAIVSAQGDSLMELRKKIYGYLGTQDLSGFYYRKDVGIN
jgi:phosphoribosylamine--glycine ligase